mmetsp:Transcript_7781/g.19278  ORF Transcript_7781/g.19278 Transcript_7781/m.19278 type:complete len:132 (+) Transcript_7781:61-456(+)
MAFAKILMLGFIAINLVFDSHTLANVLVKFFGDLPYSRKLESEADFIGLTLMTEACFNPRAAPELYKRLSSNQAEQGGSVPEYLSTHPTGEKRIADIEKMLPEVEGKYREQCGPSRAFASLGGGRGGFGWQ